MDFKDYSVHVSETARKHDSYGEDSWNADVYRDECIDFSNEMGPVSPKFMGSPRSSSERTRPRRILRVVRAGNHLLDVGSRNGISKTVTQSPFIREARSSRDYTTSLSRAAALGELRKDARLSSSGSGDKLSRSRALDFKFARNRASLISTPSLSVHKKIVYDSATDTASVSADLHDNFPPKSPVSHEIVRKVSARSQLDGGVPCDEAFKSAFVDCLEFVCEGNDEKRNRAFPRDADEGGPIMRIFPVEVARRYSPDFIHHVLRHMYLSRQSLATALVYLDRAHTLNGDSMSVCNKNVNSLVLAALILASRVIERRGYSDEILAMVSGMEDAGALRKTVSFFLAKLDGNAEITAKETKPYEDLLDQLKPSAAETEKCFNFERSHILQRNRAVQMYYPPSTPE